MKNYIVITENDIQTLLNGEEICCQIDKEMRYLITEKAFREMTSITDEQWQEAIKYLDEIIVMYATIGWAGQFGLNGVLVPLKKRYENGERTKELYDAIMACE